MKKKAKSEDTIKFKHAVSGVNAEKSVRVELKAGTYELISKVETRPGSFKIAVASPDETHLGGPDGKTEEPCTIWVQATADNIA